MIKFLIGIPLTIIVLIVLVPFVALGLVPGLSPLFGAGPKDLGIRTTKEDLIHTREKVKTETISLPKSTNPKDDYRLEGKQEANFTFSSEELTAHSNNRPWIHFPMKNMQIKIHPDGTIESSGILVISKAMPYAMGLGYSETQIQDAMQKYNIPPFEVPVYVKGKGSVTNDKVSVDAQTVKIGMVAIPADIVSQANSEAESVLDDLIQKHSNAFHAESVSFADGKMTFKGQLPKKQYVITEK